MTAPISGHGMTAQKPGGAVSTDQGSALTRAAHPRTRSTT